jgi:hypothetical protein
VELTRQQRNELFGLLSSNGIDPADCEFIADSVDTQIRHRPTGSKILLVRKSTQYLFWWYVEDGPSSGPRASRENWDEVLEQVGRWAEQVHYVNDTPDFWAELQQVPKMLAAAQAAATANAPFTPEEQGDIARKIDQAKQLVREQFELTDGQLTAIDERLDDVIEASQHVGRKTWLYTLYGAVLSTVMTDAVPPHIFQAVISSVLHGIGHIFGLGSPPPMITA